MKLYHASTILTVLATAVTAAVIAPATDGAPAIQLTHPSAADRILVLRKAKKVIKQGKYGEINCETSDASALTKDVKSIIDSLSDKNYECYADVHFGSRCDQQAFQGTAQVDLCLDENRGDQRYNAIYCNQLHKYLNDIIEQCEDKSTKKVGGWMWIPDEYGDKLKGSPKMNVAVH